MTNRERELAKALRGLIKSLPRSVAKKPKVVEATLHAVHVLEKLRVNKNVLARKR